MKISVIIPVYNGEKYLAQCIENILCQAYKNLEIIVVDDGSTDRTAEIAVLYPSVRLISQPNGGLSVARNSGIEAAGGDYIHFMDVDDLINLDYYTCMADALSLTDADMAIGGVINEVQPGLSLSFSERQLLCILEDKISFTNAGLMVCAWRYLIKRSFMQEKGLHFEAGRLMEDVKFSLEAIRLASCIVTVPGAIYYYKVREGSIMTRRNAEFSRLRREHRKIAEEFRREYFRKYALKEFVTPVSRFQYKLFGAIPVFEKTFDTKGKTKWYLFGVLVMQKKSLRVY